MKSPQAALLLLVLTSAASAEDAVEPLPVPEEHKQIVYRYIPIDKAFFQWDKMYDQMQVTDRSSASVPSKQSEQKYSNLDYYNYGSTKKNTKVPANSADDNYSGLDYYNYGTTNKNTKIRANSADDKYSNLDYYNYGSDNLKTKLQDKTTNNGYSGSDYYNYDNTDVERDETDVWSSLRDAQYKYEDEHQQSSYSVPAVRRPAKRRKKTKQTEGISNKLFSFVGNLKNILASPKKSGNKLKYNRWTFSLPQLISLNSAAKLMAQVTAFALLSALLILVAVNAVVSDPDTSWKDVLSRDFSSDDVGEMNLRAWELLRLMQHVLDAEEYDCVRTRMCQVGSKTSSSIAKILIGAGLYDGLESRQSAARAIDSLYSLLFDSAAEEHAEDRCNRTFPNCSLR